MLILGIESATGSVGCAVGDDEGVLAVMQTTRDRRHAELLAPQIQSICGQAGIALRDLAAVAVDVGPGLYTGLRVGMATAAAMAHSLGVPMIAVVSLDILAYRMRRHRGTIAAVIDARRGEVFFALYRGAPEGIERLSEPAVGGLDVAASQIAASGGETLVVGDAALRYRSMLDGLAGVEVADRGFAHPSAESLLQLARVQAGRGEFVSPVEIEPVYLRRPDAVAKWDAGGR